MIFGNFRNFGNNRNFDDSEIEQAEAEMGQAQRELGLEIWVGG